MARKKWIMTSLGLIAAMAIVAGCAAPTTPTVAPTSQQPVVVQYWSNGWFASSIAGRKALVDKFNAEHQGKIEVQYIQGNWDDGEQYMQNGNAAGGGIACVMEWWVGGTLDWYRKGWVTDLRPYVTPERRALMAEAQWQARTADDGAIVANGTVLGEPILVLLYNPEHLKKAGIEPATAEHPWTWDQLFENAAKLTLDSNGKHMGEDGFDKTKVVQWGYMERLDNEKVYENGFFFAQGRMGQSIVRQEGGSWGWFLDQNGSAAYEKYLTPVVAGIMPDIAIGISGDSLHQAFVDGKTSIILRETFATPIIHDTFPDFKFAAMPTPFDKGDKIYYQAGGENMVMAKTCQTPEEAAEFMFWMMKPENLAGYAYGNGMLPANTEALNVEPFKSDPTWDIVKNYLAKGEVFTVPFNPNFIEFRDTVLAPTMMDVASGKKTFAEANAILVEQAKVILNR